MSRSRFAPSTTGEAHPGTFLSALLVLLDARKGGLEAVLRFEDLDPQRCRPEHLTRMRNDLRWLGLEFDVEVIQSQSRPAHEAALDRLAAAGLLYPCSVSRSELRDSGLRAPDGSFRYDNRNRGRALPPGGWRACREPLRVVLPDARARLVDESGAVLEHALRDFGDPVVRRRDGAMAYLLASVVDDAEQGVSRVVRGRDLIAGTLVQNAIRERLALREPEHRHHFLLLERREKKLSKLHGAIGARALRERYSAPQLLGDLAFAARIIDRPEPVELDDLVFDWQKVRGDDLLVEIEDSRLHFSEATFIH